MDLSEDKVRSIVERVVSRLQTQPGSPALPAPVLSSGDLGIFEDVETGERLATQPWHIRGEYRKLFADFIAHYKRECLANQIDYVLLDTTEPFDRILMNYLMKRKRIGG